MNTSCPPRRSSVSSQRRTPAAVDNSPLASHPQSSTYQTRFGVQTSGASSPPRCASSKNVVLPTTSGRSASGSSTVLNAIVRDLDVPALSFGEPFPRMPSFRFDHPNPQNNDALRTEFYEGSWRAAFSFTLVTCSSSATPIRRPTSIRPRAHAQRDEGRVRTMPHEVKNTAGVDSRSN